MADSESLDEVECRSCKKRWTTPRRGRAYYCFSGECQSCFTTRRTRKFEMDICPPLYLDTNIDRLPAAQLEQVMNWKFGAKGLILLGETGKGKSRVAWTLLRRIFTETRPAVNFTWFDCVGFGHAISRHYQEEDAEDWLDSLATEQLVFMDDLGKLKLTERAEVELFGLIERRCANKLPMIVTTNDTGDSLASRMTDNRGPALIRRLREFCEPIQFL